MDNETQHGYLVLADISGFTPYLAGVELLHARDVIAELLELIVQHFEPLLRLTKFEGDAVFAYVPKTNIARDETLLEVLETTYLGFRDRVESIRRRTTCQCNACRAIPTLDLKFVVHYGEYILHSVSGITELLGSDVNLIHRLLKNSVSEVTGWKAYALFTESGMAQMNLELEGLHEQVETYEHLGEVNTYSLDLHARYKELTEIRREAIPNEEADMTISRKFQSSPIQIWDWMNDIEKRLMWESFDDIQPVLRPGGRTGTGARNHCAHGKNIAPETILDWHPFEYYTLDYPMGTQTRYLEPDPDGTQLTINIKFKMSLPRWLKRFLAYIIVKLNKMDQQFDTLVRLIGEEAAMEDSRG